LETAVVTGAGRGLGRALAERLARRGLAVLVTDVDAETAEGTALELGPPAWSGRLDVRDPAACREVADEAAGRGRLAVWVNNAGILDSGRAWDQGDEVLEATVAINFMGVVHGTRAAIARMGEDGGRILNIASLSALGPVPGIAVYAASKQAVLAFSLAVQRELREAELPIEVRALCPDTIDTRLAQNVAGDEQASLMWSGARILDVDEVADKGIELLYGARLTRTIPAYRAGVMRTVQLFPRVGFGLLPAFRRFGEWRQRRWREG
jgi:NAD(P)-dependent dehydrogenase (short-subunit alcohol dehydrogenase family)